ncbi:MAG: bifunctional 2-C-methyl-D-erythritol 4-phosphate cytidylyltransferase/2-C-methyl-D-erythritol 2,4-cyclodiphosphate synthase [Hyphomonadaceae bacterium JAD_PAG50586_4]|nr:MAG: bifunctional 2-C-methyl-D-erythritol 4-phosphate cytidylyltransferase/2-C-methyl-D-erythritol 2,4-cyclodiphosphate synthase [Hyphomonadaceae bacterium JAD_PAG50586_4]
MKVSAIIVAAGAGSRAGGELPKQYNRLLGKPVLRWSIEALLRAGVEEVVVAIGAGQDEFFRAAASALPVRAVQGGATRTDSVRAALSAISDTDVILIHDAARPGLSETTIRALIEAVRSGAIGVAPALPAADALQRVGANNVVVEEIARENLLRVQTPQAFNAAALRAAYAAIGNGTFADDLAVMRARGAETKLIAGDPRLMKITYPGDLEMLARLLDDRFVSVGQGIDAHRFGGGDHVTLCGVRIPHEKGLLGHSDADAGWHALVDAILGALGEGDIGAHFPPSDPQWKGADSEKFLRHALHLADAAGATISHVDVTLVCERPKIGPHREAMRARTAAVLDLPIDRVSVKATTTERMGFLGREEGLAAFATATLLRRSS